MPTSEQDFDFDSDKNEGQDKNASKSDDNQASTDNSDLEFNSDDNFDEFKHSDADDAEILEGELLDSDPENSDQDDFLAEGFPDLNNENLSLEDLKKDLFDRLGGMEGAEDLLKQFDGADNKPQPQKEHVATEPVSLCMDYIYYAFKDVSGYINYKQGEKEDSEKDKAYLTYGEILPLSIDWLISKLNITEDDVFYDLGSGVGKVALQFFMTTPIQHAYGIEYNKQRNDSALTARHRVKRELPELFTRHGKERELVYNQGNMLTQDYSKTSIVFTCSTCFGEDLMQGVAKIADENENIRYLMSLKPVPCERLPLKASLPIDCTWDTSTCHIYSLEDLKD